MTADESTRRLLASDLDGTLIPLDNLAGRVEDVAAFRRAFEGARDLALAYVTGRHLALALEGITAHELPIPDYLVCDVGTSVYFPESEGWSLDQSFVEQMVSRFGMPDGGGVAACLAGTRGLSEQEPEKQARFKRSFYFSGSEDARVVVRRVKTRLGRAGLRANVIASRDPETGDGLLDVLPPNVAKGTAVRFLQEKLRLETEAILYAGDSGNDLDVFRSGIPSVVVGNAPASVREPLRRRRAAKLPIFFARGFYAAGVIEGAHHFGLFTHGEA